MSILKYFPGRRPPRPASYKTRPFRPPPGLLTLAVWPVLFAGPALAGDGGGETSGQILSVVAGALALLSLLGWRLTGKFRAALASLEKISRKMADCQLQELVPEQNMKCRLTGRIGANVNELALNLQEVLLLVWNLSHQDLEALDRIARQLDSNSAAERRQSLADLEFIRHDLEEMQEIVRQFEFFNVVLQDEKLLAKPESATLQEGEE